MKCLQSFLSNILGDIHVAGNWGNLALPEMPNSINKRNKYIIINIYFAFFQAGIKASVAQFMAYVHGSVNEISKVRNFGFGFSFFVLFYLSWEKKCVLHNETIFVISLWPLHAKNSGQNEKNWHICTTIVKWF